MYSVGETIKKHRQRGLNKKIEFSAENITKDTAVTLLSNGNNAVGLDSSEKLINKLCSNDKTSNCKKRKKDKSKNIGAYNHSSENVGKKMKKCDLNKNQLYENGNICKSKMITTEENTIRDIKDVGNEKNEDTEPSTVDLKEPKKFSKRALKKRKHQHLLEDRKTINDKTLQQDHMSYLSQWKSDRSNWKFKKLKQVWLLQNLYDWTKIDDEYWDIVVEYFSNSQGKVRKTILEEAIKIIENENISADDHKSIKLKRARSIVLNLQE